MSDVVDLLEDSPPPHEPVPPTDDQLRQAIKGLLMGKDLSTVSLKALRLDLEKSFHLPVGGLDSRKADIRQLAQDLVVEAQNAPAPAPAPAVVPAPSTPVEPAAKKRRTLAQAIPTASVPSGLAAPASPVKTKGPKRKAAPSAYSLWSLEHRSTVAEELEQELQRKPTFGEISKAVPERWKAVSEADKASYEEKAKLAKAEAMDAPKEKPKKAPEANKKGKGKGKGKGNGEEPIMSRAEFFAASPVINCAFQIPGVKATESSMENLVARMFKSQGVGWFCSTKFQVPVASKEVTVQAQVVMNVAGSKHWEDGEGLEEAMKMLEQRLEANGGGRPQAPQAPQEGQVDSVAPEKSEAHQAPEPLETESAQQEDPAAAGDSSEADAAAKDEAEAPPEVMADAASKDEAEAPPEVMADAASKDEAAAPPEVMADAAAKDEAAAPPEVMAADTTEVGSMQEDVKTNEDAKMESLEVAPNEAAHSEEDSKMEEAAQAEASEAEQPMDDEKDEAEQPMDDAKDEAFQDPSAEAEVESKADADLEEKALVGGA